MMKIEVEIKEIENGWVVDDSYYGEEIYFKNFVEAKDFAQSIFSKFQREEVENGK